MERTRERPYLHHAAHLAQLLSHRCCHWCYCRHSLLGAIDALPLPRCHYALPTAVAANLGARARVVLALSPSMQASR